MSFINALFINPETGEPCDFRGDYLLSYEDFKTIDVGQMLEVIVDFFTLNNVLSIYAKLSIVKAAFQRMKSMLPQGPSAK